MTDKKKIPPGFKVKYFQNELLRSCVEAKKKKQDNVFKRNRELYIKTWQILRRQEAQPLSTIRLKAVKLGKNKKETIDLFKNFENFLKKMTDDEFIKFAKRTIKKGIK